MVKQNSTRRTPVFSHMMLNADGSQSTVAAIAAEMQRDGFPQRFIDRWLQGVGLSLHLASRGV